MKGFILAGGKGTRLHPVTYEIPKPLLPVNGKAILTYLVNLYLENGIRDIKINIPEKHADKFKDWKKSTFQEENIDFLTEKNPSGTLGPLKKIDSWFTDNVVVSNGDELKDINLEKMIRWHKENASLATVALCKVDDPSSYGVAVLKDKKIIKFLEKPNNPPSSYINSGLYILNSKVKNYFPDKDFAMLEKDLFPLLAKEEKLLGYKWKGDWQDTGTFKRWEEAIKNWE